MRIDLSIILFHRPLFCCNFTGQLEHYQGMINTAVADKIKGNYKSIKDFATHAANEGVDVSLIADIKKAFGRGRINL